MSEQNGFDLRAHVNIETQRALAQQLGEALIAKIANEITAAAYQDAYAEAQQALQGVQAEVEKLRAEIEAVMPKSVPPRWTGDTGVDQVASGVPDIGPPAIVDDNFHDDTGFR